LQSVQRQTGNPPKDLIGPEFPSLMENVWSAFKRLSNRRSSAMSGVSPITYDQILSFKTLTKTPIAPREISVIERLDDLYREVMNE